MKYNPSILNRTEECNAYTLLYCGGGGGVAATPVHPIPRIAATRGVDAHSPGILEEGPYLYRHLVRIR